MGSWSHWSTVAGLPPVLVVAPHPATLTGPELGDRLVHHGPWSMVVVVVPC